MPMPWNENYTNIDVERQLEAPMPWIGLYVAAASLVCTLAMAADTLHGFWSKKYWFPSKYFSLNATTLTLLAVAMKLPVDLTTRMYAVTDRLAKVSSLVFMSTAMANFLTSLGSMDDKDVLMNVTALGILVITVIVNVFIQVIQMHSYLSGRLAFAEEILAIGSMLLLLVMFTSSALMIPSTKRYLETKYHEMHRSALNEEHVDVGRVTTDKLRVLIKKYWVMAETSNPQFVIARSVTCTTSGVSTFLISLILLQVEIRMAIKNCRILHQSNSSYGWSTKWILLTQTIGVIVGTIAPASRWFVAINYRSLNDVRKNIRSAVTVEDYWTQKMVEWRQRSLSLRIQNRKSRKLLHDLRGLFLKFCISVQCLIVLASKLVLLISICITSPIISFLNYIRRLKSRTRISHCVSPRDQEVSESTANSELDIKHYVMLLEGEVELPTETLENICKEVDEVTHKAMMRKPKNLLELLHKSCNFTGVTEFDSRQIPSLHSQDLPYCWSLPVVTLACIALALPNVEKNKSNRLLSSVTEGVRFVKLIDKILDTKGSLANIRTAADVVWVQVELYHKWQDNDLHETSIKGKNAKEIVEEFCGKAANTVLQFKRDARDSLMRNPLNWPAKVIAANTMYRVSRTILLNHGGKSDKTDEELFEQLSIMIADILAACLTNLAHVITMKCHRNAIEEREKSVRKAALLLGETEEILALLLQRELPILAPQRDMPSMPGEESFDADVKRRLEAPMPWIGMYVAAASLICTLAISADTFHGFRSKKYWFPSKFFSLNATSLTLLAVAMKLPVDLTTRMYAATDRLAKVCTLAFMSTAMGNFMTCLGSMDDKDILMNTTALGILVVTVIVNFCVQVIQMRHFLGGRKMFAEEIIAAAFMLLSLLMVTSSAIMIPATKRYLESKYHEMLKMASDEQTLESMEEGNFTFDKLRQMIKKYWVMAETSSPQFVIARSVTCTASGIISLLTTLVLVQAEIRMVMKYRKVNITASTYGWSIKWIVLAQSIGVAVGTIALDTDVGGVERELFAFAD